MTAELTVALLQHPAGSDVDALVNDAAWRDAEIVVFPEMFSNGYADYPAGDKQAEADWRAGAVDANGNFVTAFREAAWRYRVHVVATFLEAGDPDPFNTALLIGPKGETVMRHRKVHICDFETPEVSCGRGSGFKVAEIPVRAGTAKLGLMICMDREYADGAAALSAAGAEIALVPNCCRLADDPDCGDVRIAQARGRAYETVMGMAVANYPEPKADGHSFAVDAVGKVIAEAGGDPETLLATFDLDQIRATREAESFRIVGRSA